METTASVHNLIQLRYHIRRRDRDISTLSSEKRMANDKRVSPTCMISRSGEGSTLSTIRMVLTSPVLRTA